MVTKSRTRQVKKALRDADDILHLLTGKRMKNIVGNVVNLYGEDVARKVAKFFAGPDEPELPADSPYTILGVHRDAMDVVVKGAFRALAREYHPDTGSKPDPSKFQAAVEAYNAIVEERRGAKAEKEAS